MMYVVSPRSRAVHTVERARHDDLLLWVAPCGVEWSTGDILVEPEMPATGHLCTGCFPKVVVESVDG